MKRNFLSIDPLRLDREWLGQAELYYKHSSTLADARRELDQAKAELDVVQAELDIQIRSKPNRFKLEKVTEGAIKALIPKQADYKLAHAQYLDAKHAVDIAQAAVSALDHRKRALQHLVQLQLANYFADPDVSAPADTRETLHSARKQKTRKALVRDREDDDGDDD